MPLNAPASDPLAQLRPIVLPQEGISWWPLAPGWWILLGLFLCLIALGFWLRKKAIARANEKQFQQNLLAELEEAFTQASKANTPDNSKKYVQEYLQHSNVIFKRLVNQCLHNESINTLTGRQWVSFLQQHAPDQQASNHWNCYGDSLYSHHANTELPLKDLHQLATEWASYFYKNRQKIKRQQDKK